MAELLQSAPYVRSGIDAARRKGAAVAASEKAASSDLKQHTKIAQTAAKVEKTLVQVEDAVKAAVDAAKAMGAGSESVVQTKMLLACARAQHRQADFIDALDEHEAVVEESTAGGEEDKEGAGEEGTAEDDDEGGYQPPGNTTRDPASFSSTGWPCLSTESSEEVSSGTLWHLSTGSHGRAPAPMTGNEVELWQQVQAEGAVEAQARELKSLGAVIEPVKATMKEGMDTSASVDASSTIGTDTISTAATISTATVGITAAIGMTSLSELPISISIFHRCCCAVHLLWCSLVGVKRLILDPLHRRAGANHSRLGFNTPKSADVNTMSSTLGVLYIIVGLLMAG
jgi:hypothetical protein